MVNRATPPEVYSADRLLQYRLAVYMVDNMVTSGIISQAERRIMLDALLEKYGLEKTSIYAI